MARVLFLVLFTAVPLFVQAKVFPRNGDFYVSYLDAKLTAKGHELSITRNYNSKSGSIGWFGYGWSSDFETRLTVMPDHTAVISETGGGALSFYHDESSERDAKLVAIGVSKIMAAAKLRDKLSPEAAAALGKKLLGDEEARFWAVKKYAVHSELPRKLELTAFGGGYCAGTLQRTQDGYRRNDGCEKVDDFDLRGNLVKRTYTNGHQIIFRIVNDRPVEILDTDGQSIKLEWTNEGQVNRLSASDGTVQIYEYDGNHNLTRANNPNDNAYRYDYDRHHNMTRIRYIDDSSMVMTYGAGGTTTSVTQRSGQRTEYTYSIAVDNPNKYSTRIRMIDPDGAETSQTLEFEDELSATGERRLQRYALVNQNQETSVEIDEKGRIKRKTLKMGEFIAYTFHPTLNKVATVNLNDEITAHFEYNAAGDLIHADDSDGQVFDIEYNAKNQIAHISTKQSEGSSSDLHLKYNSEGKPVEIRRPDVGAVTVQYDSAGEISSVESDGGATVALGIMETYKTVQQLIKLAEQ